MAWGRNGAGLSEQQKVVIVFSAYLTILELDIGIAARMLGIPGRTGQDTVRALCGWVRAPTQDEFVRLRAALQLMSFLDTLARKMHKERRGQFSASEWLAVVHSECGVAPLEALEKAEVPEATEKIVRLLIAAHH